MRRVAAEALEMSIVHWKRMRAAECIKDLQYEEPCRDDCALCETFYEDCCEGCPVYAESGITRCGGTPYRRAAEAFDEWKEASRAGRIARRFLGATEHINAAREYWRAAADLQIAYLESLRVPESQQTEDTPL